MERPDYHHRALTPPRSGSFRHAELPLPCRIGEFVDHARERLGNAVARTAWARLAAIEDPLPPVASEAALELRLGRGAQPVDFELGLRRDTAAGARAAAALATPEAGAICERVPGWRCARRFLRAWSEPDSPLHRAISVAWLEFDVPESGPVQPFTVVTFDPAAAYPDGRIDRELVERALEEGLGLLGERPLDATHATLERALAALPPSASLRHAAVRPVGDGAIARLVLRMASRDLLDYLPSLAWPGDPAALRELMRQLHALDSIHGVNLDLADGLLPRVGIEFHHASCAGRDPRWRRLLDALEALGACTPRARRAVAGWYQDPTTAGAAPAAPAPGGRFAVRRELLVKVVHDPGAPPAAKAYLTLGPRLLLDA